MDVAALVDGNLAIHLDDPHFKEVHQFAEALHLEFYSQLCFHIGNISSMLTGNMI